MSRRKFGVLTSLVTMLLTVATVRAEQDSVAAARDLYASAAYEDALAVLNRLPGSGRPVDETRTIEQYRAFCLLALGRAAEAEHAIESVISADPMYRPSVDLSPRVRTAFSDVRRRVLPAIIQQKYAQAKAAYDRKEYAAAADLFSRVLETMSDPDVATQVDRAPLSDMKMLALGFKDLATTASAPPPPLPAAAPAPVPEPVVPKAPRIYTSSDGDVSPPVAVRQDLPAYPGQVVIPRQGLLEVLIDENGLVEGAVMRVSVSPHYDQLAVAAARAWRFRPATLNGAPVKYRKAVQVTIKPMGPPR
jgi:TonB family protein